MANQHKRLDGDDPRIEAIFATHRFVPLGLYDEITKLAEYAIGEIIEEHNGLVEQLQAAQQRERDRTLDAADHYERARRAEEQLEAAQRELHDATRMVTAIVATVAPDGRFLRVTPRVLREDYELTRMDDPDGSVVFVASNPASTPHGGSCRCEECRP